MYKQVLVLMQNFLALLKKKSNQTVLFMFPNLSKPFTVYLCGMN